MSIAEELIARVDADRAKQKSPRSSVIEEIIDRVDADKGPGFLTGLKDVAASAVVGLGNIPKSLTQIGEMATGGSEIASKGTQLIDDAQIAVRNKIVSDETLAQQREISRVIEDPNAAWYDVVNAVFKNPTGAMTQAAESLSSFLIPAGAGVGAARVATGASRTLTPTASVVARALLNPRAAQMGTVVGTNALMNAADTFSSNYEGELSDRYKGAGVSAAMSLLASALTGGGGEKVLSDIILRGGENVTRNGLTGIAQRAMNAAKVPLREGAQEYIEEGGNSAGSDVAMDRAIDLANANRQGTYGGMLGAASGGSVGVLNAALKQRPQSASVDAPPTAHVPTSESVMGAQEAAARIRAMTPQSTQSYQAVDSQQQAPVAQAVPASQIQPDMSQSQPATAETRQKVILQNRNRSSDASVQQMNAIAAKPNYLRVSGSRDFGNGAPVVAYGSVPQQQLGKQEMSVTADDERIPVQYAVVEAGEVLTSNHVNGSINPEYETAPESRIRAIAGNGRVAGLTEAYRRGTASQYRAELREDAANLGIDPAVIDGMKAPILVRVMPSERVRSDIGDISNTSGNLSMNAVETAANDVNRINFDKIVFNDNGEADIDTVIGFVRQMPIAEQGALIDTNGQPTRAAHERFANALFKKAYGDDELVRLSAQAVDPEIRNVISALSRVAPKMARLESLGDLDIRGLVKQAAQVVVNAHRQGVSLAKFAAQADITMDPDVRVIVECFAQNARSVKEMARVLEIAADFAYSEGTKDDVDMFGSVERATRQDVLNRIQEETNGRQQQSANAAATRNQTAEVGDQPARTSDLAESTRAESVEENVQREAGRTSVNGRGSANDKRTQEGFQLTGQTEAEAQAESSRLQEIEDDERREREEAERRAREERIAREERQAAERYRDNFSLEDDTVPADDAVSGQQGLMFSRNPRTGQQDVKFSVAWHGSPHVFETFASEHIGSGEGAQAHGWGLYFAQDRETAQAYRDNLSEDGEGRLFEVEIPDVDIMLDERKKISMQPPVVREAYRQYTIKRFGKDQSSFTADYENGFDFYAGLERWLGSPKQASNWLNENGVKGITYNGSQDGRCYVVFDDQAIKVLEYYSRRNENTEGNTSPESIRQSLSEDKQLGDAFSRLEDSGVVEIVERIDTLPENVRARIDEGSTSESLSAMKSVEANIRRGKASMAKALQNHTSVFRAMFRNGLGWVDFLWGYEGDSVIHARGRRRGEKGLLHIIEARWRKNGYSEKQISELLDDVVETIARGRAVKEGDYKQIIQHNGVIVVLIKNRPYNNWLLSGYRNTATGDSVTAFDARGTTNSGSTPGRTGEGAVADSYETILGATVLTVKRSEAGDIQAVYDPETGKSYLIASNIKPGDEKGVLVHEVGVHMAADRGGREVMRPLIMRAKQIVYNGNSNGDTTAKRVYQRMKDADLINSRGFIKEGFDEEAFAYLAEEALNAKDKASSPIREWLAAILSKIRVWLYKRGLFVAAENLSDRDLVNIAVENVRAMAETTGSSDEGVRPIVWLSMRKDSQDTDAVPVDAVVKNRLADGNGAWGFHRDASGGFVFGAGEWAYNHMTSATRMFFNAVDKASGHTFNLNTAPKEFREAFRKYRAEVDNARSDIAAAAEAMNSMDESERRLVSDVIEKMVAPGVNPPEHVVQVAASIQNLMDAQTDELVRLGLLSAESAERWRGQYLPRVYLKQSELFEEAKKNFKKIFGTGRGMHGNFLKGRGLFRTVVGTEAIEQHKMLGWEVRDPNWSDAQGELQFSGEGAEPRTPTVVMWRDFTPQERQQMGECRDVMVRLVLGYMQTQEDIALARFFDSLSRDTRFSSSTPNEDWVRVPDGTIGNGSSIKRYGALAGKYVSPEVWAEIEHLKGDGSSASRLARSLMAAWKEGKTALNPVSHVNNIAGNMAMASFAGVPALDPRTYMSAFREIRENSVMFAEAQRAGLFSGNYSHSEIMEMIPLDDIRNRLTGIRPGYEKIIDMLMNIGSLGLRGKLRAAYEFEDSLFKYIIYRHARQNNGMSVEDAVDYAGQFIFNYDDLPSGARKIRDTALPFFSWTYKAIPVLLRTAMLYPHRFFAPAAMVFAVNKSFYLFAAASALGGAGDWEEILKKAEEIEDAEQEALPEYAQGYSLFGTPKFLRLWSNDDGTANFLDMSRLMPGGDLADINNQMGGMPWIQPLMPNSPQLGLFLAVFANKDSFTGREIVSETDDKATAFRKRLGYVYRNVAPALAPGNYHFNRLADAVAAETGASFTYEPFVDITGRDWNGRQMELSRALSHTFGFKVRPFDWEQEINRKARSMVGEIRDKMGQVRFNAKSKARGSMSDEAFRSFAERTAEDIQERTKKLQEFREKTKPLVKP